MIKEKLQICNLIPYIQRITKSIATYLTINVNSRDDKEEKINNNENVMNSTNKENQILNETKK